MIDKKIFEQIEIYLEKYCQDSDYLAKKINPNWTGREYITPSTKNAKNMERMHLKKDEP
ncbi:MAG: hypothetical protein IK062_04630 [Selenomonadaceae bacterium]|nr:hypothetical protein [Selenomonadaceae bacterium]